MKERLKIAGKAVNCVEFYRTSQYSAMEVILCKEYWSFRERGIKIKGWWFKARAKQLLEAAHMNSQFKIFNAWFHWFKCHYKISLWCPTNKAQRIPKDKRELIRNFHWKICQEAAVGSQIGKLGQFTSSFVANVDQTLLPFTFTNGSTYETS